MRLLAVALSLLLALPSSAQVQKADSKSIDRIVTSAMKAFAIPGLAVAVVRDDRVIHVAGYGTRELGGSEPVGPDTLFQIASTSKAFTSTALAMLVEQKALSWDDPVRKYVPEFRLPDLCADSQVTVRDILSHRTGVGRHDELWDNSPLTREQVVAAVGNLEMARPFRSGYGYHNIMFITAGEVVKGASGIPWDDFVRTRIFKPLGMSSTVLGDAEWEAAEHATGYRFDWKTGKTEPQKPIETATLGSGGAIKSSARDMARWIRFQLNEGTFEGQNLVDPEILGETRMPQTVIRLEDGAREANPESNLLAYGLGWNIQDYRGELLVSHAGALNGFRTHVDLLPKRKSGFVVMENIGRGYALLALRNALTDLLTGKQPRDWNAYYLMIEAKANQKEEKQRQELLATRVSGTSPSAPLADYAGTYVSPSHGEATVQVADGRLVLRWSRLDVPLAHFHYDVFSAVSAADGLDEQVTFRLDPVRKVTGFEFYGTTFVKR